MSDTFTIANESLLAPVGLSVSELSDTLGYILSGDCDDGDIYLQTVAHEAWVFEDGIVKAGSFNLDSGFGVRAISGEKSGYAYANILTPDSLKEASHHAAAIAKSGQPMSMRLSPLAIANPLYPALNPLPSLDEVEKIALLKQVDAAARAADPRVDQVRVDLSASYNVVMIVHPGGVSTDVRPLVRMNVSVVVEQNGRREQGYAGCGSRSSYRYLLDEDRGLKLAKRAVDEACLNLEAIPAPAGVMPVVLASGWPGVLLHEAVGHGLEGDFNRKGSSIFSGRIGDRVATEGCTVVDDGTLDERRGSLSIDDEGTPTERTVLIENGILKNYMQDKLNAKLMNAKSTGNGRRESYAHMPIPRMTNTFMLAGEHDPAEIIASVDKGIYAVNFGGGQVDITSGKFVFSMNEAYMIEKGKVTTPIKGATLIGNGPDVLTKVSMIGNDLALDPGIGTCGKDGQGVAVGVGQPTLRIDALTVGGTADIKHSS